MSDKGVFRLAVFLSMLGLVACVGSDGADEASVDTGWQEASLVERDNVGNAMLPQVDMDSNGNAVMVWHQYDGLRLNIWVNRYMRGTGWGQPELIEIENGGDAYDPQISMDSNGNAMVVWHQDDGTRYNIWANRYVVGLGWGTAELIEMGDGWGWSPQVTVNNNGSAIAIWYQYDGMRNSIWANSYVTGVGWGSAELIETNAGGAASPQISMDNNGNAMAVWVEPDSVGNNSIWANYFVTGLGWQSAELIEASDWGASSPKVVMDGNGNALVLWQQFDGNNLSVWANRFVFGVGWGQPELIEIDNGGDAYDPQISMDSNGNAMVVWHQDDGTRYNIWANRYVVGLGWGTAELIEMGDGWGWSPQVAVDFYGNAVVVWEQDDVMYGVASIWSNRYDVGIGWGTAELIETNNAGRAWAPQVAMDTNNNAVAVWYEWDGLRDNIWANSYRAQ